ncbi:MAG: outer membrane protein assembly factor BamD [Gammaproteobacteria bacterium]|nr:outer membrane protein assembly factor BamD [Gammaproteobacteria bacterium]
MNPTIIVSTPIATRRPSWRLALVCLLTLVAVGCAKDTRELQSGAEELFTRGTKAMNSKNFRNAISYYEGLEARFPFSNQAKQAQLNLIYCYYKNGEPDSAIDAATQFERENPTHPRVDYALYIRGLANFSTQHKGYHRLFGIDLAKRPPVLARESFATFSRLLQRYPDSIYTHDARQRLIFLRNRLAKHENYVADYYFRRGSYVAALNRAKSTLENYDGAPAVADSLYMIIGAYEKLGMQDLAAESRRTLAENYPDARKPEVVKKRFFFF